MTSAGELLGLEKQGPRINERKEAAALLEPMPVFVLTKERKP